MQDVVKKLKTLLLTQKEQDSKLKIIIQNQVLTSKSYQSPQNQPEE